MRPAREPWLEPELRYAGTRCSRKRVARLMRSAGLEGVHRRRVIRTTVRDRDAAPAPDSSTARSARRPQTGGGRRHHVRPDLVGLPVCRGRRRRLLADGRRLVDGRPPADRARPRCPRHGDQPTTARRGTRSPLRPGHAVHEPGLRPALPGGRDQPVDGLDRRRLRQRARRELLRVPPRPNCSTGRPSAPGPTPGWRCSTTSRPSTTPTAAIRLSITSRRPSSRGGVRSQTITVA
jgi:hypothetical protein